MSYHVDRFHAAVTVLAGHGHIKQRLIKAYEENLADVSDDDLPIAVKQSFANLRHELSCVSPANGEGAICASVRKMSVDEAARCAAALVNIFVEMSRLGESGRNFPPLKSDDPDVIPPFLVKSN